MSGFKHTPGPWRVHSTADGLVMADDKDTRIAATFAVPGDIFGVANARLIAAAPDLLEALRPLDAMGDAGLSKVILAALRPHERESFLAAVSAARAAIAKATGDTTQ